MAMFASVDKWIDWLVPLFLAYLLQILGPRLMAKVKALFRSYKRRELLKIKKARWSQPAIYSGLMLSHVFLALFIQSFILFYYFMLANPLLVKLSGQGLGFWMALCPVLACELAWLYRQSLAQDLIRSAKKVGVV